MDLSRLVMYIIAGTIVVCSAIVMLLNGPDGMPYEWYGIAIAALFVAISLAFTRVRH